MVWHIWRNGQKYRDVHISNRIKRSVGRKTSKIPFLSKANTGWNEENRKADASWYVPLQVCTTVVPAQMELVSKKHKTQHLCWSRKRLGQAYSSWSNRWLCWVPNFLEVQKWVNSSQQTSDKLQSENKPKSLLELGSRTTSTIHICLHALLFLSENSILKGLWIHSKRETVLHRDLFKFEEQEWTWDTRCLRYKKNTTET